ncbi:hypothetical protein TNCV_2840581 [Trichonephila clavipes]|uniref:Uncharacterized protein n=1 Tax=Trichonephila clavipes TaxID=2585209 RepID=A0A8X6V348_TRICX|nr:hypothetical protein TNCV_2840581 [Trichonephila clavipes]
MFGSTYSCVRNCFLQRSWAVHKSVGVRGDCGDLSSEQHVARHPRYVHVWGFWWPGEVFKFRKVLLEPLYSNSGRVGCRIVLLKFPKSVGMRNGQEWVQEIRQDAYAPVRIV